MSKPKNDTQSSKIDKYKINQTIGKGTFGKVKLGIYLPTNSNVAIKILEKSKMVDQDDKERAIREMNIMRMLNHKNVIKVSEVIQTSDRYYIIMEYCEGGELFNHIVKKRRLSEDEASFFFYQLIQGLEYIHSLGVVHRDLKPENLLLSHDKTLKIIDFGLSNYFSKTLLSTPCGSPCYASPEMVSGNKYNGFRIDIWATGIILYAMVCGYLPFEDKDNEVLFKKILRCKLDFPPQLSSLSKDMIRRILVTDPEKRITIKGIKNHQLYLKGEKIFQEKFKKKNKEILIQEINQIKLPLSNRDTKEEEEQSNDCYSPLKTEVPDQKEIERKINSYMNRKIETDVNKRVESKDNKDINNNNNNIRNINNRNEVKENLLKTQSITQSQEHKDESKTKNIITVRHAPKNKKLKHLNIQSLFSLNSMRLGSNNQKNKIPRLNTISSPNKLNTQNSRPITIKNAVINLNMIKPKFYFPSDNKKEENLKARHRTKSSSINPRGINNRNCNLTLLNSLIHAKISKEIKAKDNLISTHHHYATNICHTEDSLISKTEKTNIITNKNKKNLINEHFNPQYLQTEIYKNKYKRNENEKLDKIRKQLSVNVNSKKRKHKIVKNNNNSKSEMKQEKKYSDISDIEKTIRTIREKMKQLI